MKKPLLIMLLCACSAPDFTGIWSGALTANTSAACGGSKTDAVRWTIRQADALEITPDTGTCGVLRADVAGRAAELRAKACPNGTAFTGGTLELSTPERLSVRLTYTDGSCTATVKGTLDLE